MVRISSLQEKRTLHLTSWRIVAIDITCVDLWIPYAKIIWFVVSANECIHSANILCDPVYSHAHSLNTKFTAFLNSKKTKCFKRRKKKIREEERKRRIFKKWITNMVIWRNNECSHHNCSDDNSSWSAP